MIDPEIESGIRKWKSEARKHIIKALYEFEINGATAQFLYHWRHAKQCADELRSDTTDWNKQIKTFSMPVSSEHGDSEIILGEVTDE